MQAGTPNTAGESSRPARQRPVRPHRVVFAAEGDGKFKLDATSPPSEIFIEATDTDGEVAYWFDDYWWLERLRQWADRQMVIHFLPSPGALLNPVVLHHLVMIKRVAPKWRVAGYGYTGDIRGDAEVESLARSAYDEVRLLEGSRPGRSGENPEKPSRAFRVEDIFARVRTIQKQCGASKPILVKAREIPQAPGDRRDTSDLKVEPTGEGRPESKDVRIQTQPMPGKATI